MKKKIELLKGLQLFKGLSEEELEVVAGYSGYYRYQKGDVIFRGGQLAGRLFIIERGSVQISKHEVGDSSVLDPYPDGMDQSGRVMARFISGECFGELDLINGGSRSEIAIAEDDTTLLIFPKKELEFNEVCRRRPEIFADIFHNILAMIAGRIRNANRLISEKAPWVQELKRQLLSDRLTGLYNRTFLEEDLRELLPGYGESTSLLIVKPDNFKIINDTFGHETGDRVLKGVAGALRSVIRDVDLAVRYRGDEFAVILPGTAPDQVMAIARKIQEAIGKIDVCGITGAKVGSLRVSIGYATYPQEGVDNLELIRIAFERMLEVRRRGMKDG
ncbi:MAG: diguanylate cyclase [Spirochaetota bacterium]